MGKWRALFEANQQHLEDGGSVPDYTFGPPATASQIIATEQRLGLRFPADLREMLSEFDGVWRQYAGLEEPEIWYLDLAAMVEVAGRQRAVGWEQVFSGGELDKVVFVCGYDGWAQLWALCVEEVAGHAVGAVVYHDHDSTEFEAGFPSLAAFVRHGPK